MTCPFCGAAVPIKVGAEEAKCNVCNNRLKVFAATLDTNLFGPSLGAAIERFLKSLGFEVRRFTE